MAAGDVTTATLTKGGPSLSGVFGTIDRDLDRDLRKRLLASQRRLTDWVLATPSVPPWSLRGFTLTTREGPEPGWLSADVSAGPPREEVRAQLWLGVDPASGLYATDLLVTVMCRCRSAHWDPHMVATNRYEARLPDEAVGCMEDMVDFALEHLPARTTAEWIALGEEPHRSGGLFTPRQRELDNSWPALFDPPDDVEEDDVPEDEPPRQRPPGSAGPFAAPPPDDRGWSRGG